MLTIRPNPRPIMPSTVALISMIAVIMLALQALCQSSSSQSRKSPGGGPPALLTRMSGAGQAASAPARPAGVVMSPTTGVTLLPLMRAISAAAASSASLVRAVIVTRAPFLAKASAQPRPSPLLAAHTSAVLPAMPRSMPASLRIGLSRPAPTGLRASATVIGRCWPSDAASSAATTRLAASNERSMRRTRYSITASETTSWRSANSLSRTAPSSASSGAPIATAGAARSREARSGRRSVHAPTGRRAVRSRWPRRSCSRL